MATIVKQMFLNVHPDKAWDALRDFQAVHTRIAPGFLTDSQPADGGRFVTFANGTSALELLVTIDDERRRLVYAIRSERLVHYSASAQITPEGEGKCRFVWTIDLLPDALAGYVDGQMEEGLRAMKPAMEKA